MDKEHHCNWSWLRSEDKEMTVVVFKVVCAMQVWASRWGQKRSKWVSLIMAAVPGAATIITNGISPRCLLMRKIRSREPRLMISYLLDINCKETAAVTGGVTTVCHIPAHFHRRYETRAAHVRSCGSRGETGGKTWSRIASTHLMCRILMSFLPYFIFNAYAQR